MNFHNSPSDLIRSKETVIWIGALSFESRCVGSISALIEDGVHVSFANALNYPTNLSPKSEGEQGRALNRKLMETLLRDRVEFCSISPYKYARFLGELDRITMSVLNRGISTVVIDITCLTKLHTLAVAYWLLNRTNQPRVILAYSQPEYYGNPSKNIWGKGRWLNDLVIRLDLDSSDSFSSTAAILILGHEGDRLRLALNEVEASDGLVITPLPIGGLNSRLLTVTNAQNSWLFAELDKGTRQGFSQHVVPTRNITMLISLISNFCKKAKAKGARVVLCPFGPKTFVFLSGYASLTEYPENTWLSYPIPVSYDPNYSVGYRYTIWFDPMELSGA